VYRFGAFELDSWSRELRKHGVRIKLQDQPLRILLLLVQHPGEVVTREQIQSELWPAGTYVDYENAINSSVRKLREALGDNPSNPRFIETLSRRGYRLLVPASRDGQAATPPEAPRPTVRRPRWLAAAVGGVLVLGAIAAVLLIRHRSASEFVLPPAVPLTSYSGLVCCPSFSPDGTRVAFAWNGSNGDNFDIYVKLIGQGEPLRLTQDAAVDSWPAWSPDGRWIAFERSGGGGVWSILVIPAMGGPEREVTNVRAGLIPGYSGICSLSWSRDGRSLFAPIAVLRVTQPGLRA
jgi:DNA-binding winged helix-turn-helix (wHTH) protein